MSIFRFVSISLCSTVLLFGYPALVFTWLKKRNQSIKWFFLYILLLQGHHNDLYFDFRQPCQRNRKHILPPFHISPTLWNDKVTLNKVMVFCIIAKRQTFWLGAVEKQDVLQENQVLPLLFKSPGSEKEVGKIGKIEISSSLLSLIFSTAF